MTSTDFHSIPLEKITCDEANDVDVGRVQKALEALQPAVTCLRRELCKVLQLREKGAAEQRATGERSLLLELADTLLYQVARELRVDISSRLQKYETTTGQN